MRLIRALPYDIDEILRIEEEYFSEYSRKFTNEKISELMEINPYIFYVVKDWHGSVFAAAVIVPVIATAYDKLRSGQASDLCDLESNEIVPPFSDTEYYLLESVAASRSTGELDAKNASAEMTRGIIEIILKTKAQKIVTSPVTPEGRNIAQKMGFKLISKDMEHNQDIYELEVTPEIRQKYSALLGIKEDTKIEQKDIVIEPPKDIMLPSFEEEPQKHI